ncbi:MAG: DUF4158 domain-containing protein [Methanobacterium sp.]|uniref:DUF4158 domain-containing protein n=1 Tax=Methanobacterium sp. TaxID=2164 RepID=UPI003D64EFCC|nr:DUF4158 domain-containing protein [Methanobacterium sp.]
MKDLYFTKQNISESITFSEKDRTFIEQFRSNHNRFGFAYQMAFVYLTGCFPTQDPLEIIDDLLCFTATELGINSDEINKYSKRRQTIAEHQEKIRVYLNLRRFGETESSLLKEFLYKESCRLEQTSSLMAKAQEFLRNNQIILPANYAIRRIIGEQRDAARKYIFTKLFNQLPIEIKEKIEELLVITENRISTYQILKEPPGYPTPLALLKLIDKINYIKQTGIIEIDISWINNNFQKLLARKARTLSSYRIKEFQQPHKYTIMTCFLWETYRDTVDHIIEMHNKLITNTYTRAETELGSQLKKRRQYLNTTLLLFKTIGKALLNEELCNDELRPSIFNTIPPAKLEAYVNETEKWLSGKKVMYSLCLQIVSVIYVSILQVS